MALTPILGFDIWSGDIKQAYLQAGSDLRRKIFVRPEMVYLAPDELLQLVGSLYGLTESDDSWCETATCFHLGRLRMKQSTGDFSLFFRCISDRLVELSGTYVDDVLQAGTPEMNNFQVKKWRKNLTSRHLSDPPSGTQASTAILPISVYELFPRSTNLQTASFAKICYICRISLALRKAGVGYSHTPGYIVQRIQDCPSHRENAKTAFQFSAELDYQTPQEDTLHITYVP